MRKRDPKLDGPRVNNQIRAREIRLIGGDGHQFGVISIDRARDISEEEGLDLVEISPNSKPPVVKLIDYGKYKYQIQKKASEAKKKQAVVVLKEVQFRPNIEQHDLDVKLKKIYKFLDQGDKVKLLMQFRGREMAYSHVGRAKLDEIIQKVLDYGGQLESAPQMMGNRYFAMVSASPQQKKK